MQKFVALLVVSSWMVLMPGSLRPAAAQAFVQHNLVSDQAGQADLMDPNLVNSWGLAAGPNTFWWVGNNGTGTATLYNGNTGAKVPLVVTVPGEPTGVAFNGGTGFVVSDGMHSGPALFLFASEDGSISGWNSKVPPPAPSMQAFVAVPASTAVYKGLAIASTESGDMLYATNFNAGTVDVFDSGFNPVHMMGAFVDPDLPAGYAPFGIANLDGTIYVTYAQQDDAKHDDVPGAGHGFVDAFDTTGQLLRRVASGGDLNSPWGLAIAPGGFGRFTHDLLVGNFGDGRIHAFEPKKPKPDDSHHDNTLRGTDGQPITIDGLWSLVFGNGALAGPTRTLFFTAGPDGESHGLFGTLTLVHGHDEDEDGD